jgi:hypothetical protein
MSIYSEAVLEEVWRVISLLDRNPASETKGSFSREHWSWKFNDFPYPRMQEAVLTLTYLLEWENNQNPIYNSEAVKSYVEDAFKYWIRLQHNNGSFDEAYPFEQCLAATAFTTFYVGSAFELRRNKLPETLKQEIKATLTRAGNWLCQNDETHGLLSNHLAAAALALEIVSDVTGKDIYKKRGEFFLHRILKNQSKEGWFPEYEGSDPGYHTQAFYYLALYYKRTACKKTKDALIHFAEFQKYFFLPDGTVGGEYGSRNTEFYFPAGFEIMADEIPDCASIAVYMRDSIKERRVCGPWAMDVFNLFPILNSYLTAHKYFSKTAESKAEDLPFFKNKFSRYFSDAGFWVINEEAWYAIVGLSKGGTVSVFNKTKQTLSARHAGCILIDGKKIFGMQVYQRTPEVFWEIPGQSVKLKPAWKKNKIPVFYSWLFIAFRLFTLTFGRFAGIASLLKKLIVYVLIDKKNLASVVHERKITLNEDGILIEDSIKANGTIKAVSQFIGIHMGSSQYADVRTPLHQKDYKFNAQGDLKLKGQLGLDGQTWSEVKS